MYANTLKLVDRFEPSKDEKHLRDVLTVEQRKQKLLTSESWGVVFKEADGLIDDLREIDTSESRKVALGSTAAQ
jgi:hypothetical protein